MQDSDHDHVPDVPFRSSQDPESDICANSRRSDHPQIYQLPSATRITTNKFNTVSGARVDAVLDHPLQDIQWVEGEITTVPSNIRRMLQSYCSRHQTQDLPCTKPLWRRNTSLYTTRHGYARTWISVMDGQEVMVGMFKYGSNHQIILAEAPRGKRWSPGEVVVIVFAGGMRWKVWTGQADVDNIPASDSLIECRTPGTKAFFTPKAGADGKVSSSDACAILNSADEGRSLINRHSQHVSQSRTGAKRRRSEGADGKSDHRGEGSREDSIDDGTEQDNTVSRYFRKKACLMTDLNSEPGAISQPAQRHNELGRSTMNVTRPHVIAHLLPSQGRSINARLPTQSDHQLNAASTANTQVSQARPALHQPSQGAPVPSGNFDLNQVTVIYISATDVTSRNRPFKSCSSTDLFFRNAYGASIIKADGDKLSVTINGEVIDVLRDMPEDFEEVVEKIKAQEVQEVEVRNGADRLV